MDVLQKAVEGAVTRFRPTGYGKLLLSMDTFAISYNASPGYGSGVFEGDDGSDETALLVGNDFYILNGDFRQEYESLVDSGINACLQFFIGKPELVSSWSNSIESATARIGR